MSGLHLLARLWVSAYVYLLASRGLVLLLQLRFMYLVIIHVCMQALA